MINIIHNRIWLTHLISVHSHRGAYTFHLHVSINFDVIILTRAVNLVLEPFTSVQSWATILEICGTSLQYPWALCLPAVSLDKLPKSVRLTGNPWDLTGLTLTVAHNVATVNQHDTLVELIHSKIHFNINMSNNCKRQLHYTYFFKMASDESLFSSFGGISNN